jgi:Arabinosyltransferase concanavalin like domain
VLLLGALAVLAAIAFPLAPVLQPQVTYSWRAADGPAAIPLMPYQPVQLTARTDCATAFASGPGERILLSTVPYAGGALRPDPSAQPLSGLRLTAVAGALRVESAGVELGTVSLPVGRARSSSCPTPAAPRCW